MCHYESKEGAKRVRCTWFLVGLFCAIVALVSGFWGIGFSSFRCPHDTKEVCCFSLNNCTTLQNLTPACPISTQCEDADGKQVAKDEKYWPRFDWAAFIICILCSILFLVSCCVAGKARYREYAKWDQQVMYDE